MLAWYAGGMNHEVRPALCGGRHVVEHAGHERLGAPHDLKGDPLAA